MSGVEPTRQRPRCLKCASRGENHCVIARAPTGTFIVLIRNWGSRIWVNPFRIRCPSPLARGWTGLMKRPLLRLPMDVRQLPGQGVAYIIPQELFPPRIPPAPAGASTAAILSDIASQSQARGEGGVVSLAFVTWWRRGTTCWWRKPERS